MTGFDSGCGGGGVKRFIACAVTFIDTISQNPTSAPHPKTPSSIPPSDPIPAYPPTPTNNHSINNQPESDESYLASASRSVGERALEYAVSGLDDVMCTTSLDAIFSKITPGSAIEAL